MTSFEKSHNNIQRSHVVTDDLTYLTEEHGIVAVQWQVKCHLIWSRLKETEEPRVSLLINETK